MRPIKARLECMIRFIVQSIVLIIICAILFGCAVKNEPSGITINDGSSEAPIKISETTPNLNTEMDKSASENTNMVDERFELLSLVFRLAGRDEYSDADTEYQQQLISEFDAFKEHPAVEYASNLPLGYDAVFKFSVHILKDGSGFVFIQDIDSLVEDGRWTRQSAADFLPMLNDFYDQSGFAAFYQLNADFYEAETERFIEQTYSMIDIEWFRTYVDPANLRCVYSPSNSRHNYGATVNDTIVYSAVSSDGSAIVHEFCHSFANPIAHKWYDENTEFKKWCDDTVNPKQLPSYTNGKIIAGEYVTRAYNILYYTDRGYAPLPFFLGEKGSGFPYIEDVYAMITPYEKSEMGDDKIKSILGLQYEMGVEQSFSIGNRVFCWKVLSLTEPLPNIYMQTEVGNAFGSKTGDVLYVEDSDAINPFLLIDLGETTFQGNSGYRKYSRIPIE